MQKPFFLVLFDAVQYKMRTACEEYVTNSDGLEIMFEPRSFFTLDAFQCADLFEGSEYVWDALRNLKGYMDQHVGKLLVHDLLTNGQPLSEPLILHESEWGPASDCRIEYDNVTGGGLKIMRDGIQLKGASMVMAGAVILGSRIRIGKGVLVESGAWIRETMPTGRLGRVRENARFMTWLRRKENAREKAGTY